MEFGSGSWRVKRQNKSGKVDDWMRDGWKAGNSLYE